MQVDIITYHVFQLLADKLFVRGFENMVKTYRLFHDLNPLSVSAGWIFECHCHRIICGDGGRQLSLIPLTLTSPSIRKKTPFKLCRLIETRRVGHFLQLRAIVITSAIKISLTFQTRSTSFLIRPTNRHTMDFWLLLTSMIVSMPLDFR